MKQAKTGNDLTKLSGKAVPEPGRRLAEQPEVDRFLLPDIQIAFAQGGRGPAPELVEVIAHEPLNIRELFLIFVQDLINIPVLEYLLSAGKCESTHNHLQTLAQAINETVI